MARCHFAGQFGQDCAVEKHLRDMAKAAAGEEFVPVEADDADGFLAAVLQGMKAERGHRCGFLRADDAKYAAFLAEFVAVSVEEGMREVHHGSARAVDAAHVRACSMNCKGQGSAAGKVGDHSLPARRANPIGGRVPRTERLA